MPDHACSGVQESGSWMLVFANMTVMKEGQCGEKSAWQDTSASCTGRFDWRQVQGRDRTAHCPPHTASSWTGAIIQDDNAIPHRARVVTGFLQQHQVTQMDWPAYSPDLAPKYR